ncbi:MAG: alpha/beta hydrolase [Clostridia bacterium]|nr:alpha/beta hydrolase [Clostridia bacterium]
MLDFLDKITVIEENDYHNLMTTQVEPYLEKRREDRYFFSADGKKLHCEVYEKLLSRGAMVILHGFTESAEKFREITYYFRKAGYSVYALDLRGHGKSHHDSPDPLRVDIDTFDTYAEDLNSFIENIVKPSAKDRNIFIYSHSLGSTVALLYMMKHPYTVSKAVLSSPMICGNMGMPTAVAGTVAKLLCKAGGKNIPAPGRCVFDQNQTVDNSDATSKARFEYYHTKRIKEPLYQTSGPSFSWVKASLEARDKIISNSISQLRTKMLIFKPETDRQLLGEWTDRFAEMAKVKIKDVKNSRHEIFMSGDETLKWYMEEILEFFA